MPFHETCGKGIAPNADTVESFLNEVVTGAKYGAGRCRNPCVCRAIGNTVQGVVPVGVWGGSDGARPTGGQGGASEAGGRWFPMAVVGSVREVQFFKGDDAAERVSTSLQAGPCNDGRALSTRLLVVTKGLEPTVWMQGARTGQEGLESRVAGPSPLSWLTLDLTGTGCLVPCRGNSSNSAPNR